MGAPSVSVVMPTYNKGQYIVEAVESVLAQTVPPLELIVVDDGSTDDSRERLRAYAGRMVYRYQANQGVSAARNLGVCEARGDLVAFLDSDDVWHPRKLELQLQVFREHPDLGLVGTGGMYWPVQTLPEVAIGTSAPVFRIPWPDLAVKNRLITSAVMVYRSILSKAGEFDTELQGPEDHDLWLRIAALASVANLELPLTGYRMVAGSVSMHPEKCLAGMLRVLQKLDERDAWGGDLLLRRRAYAYRYHACSWIYLANCSYRSAVVSLLRSLAYYPLPFRLDDVATRFERPKRLIRAVAALVRSTFGVLPRDQMSARGTGEFGDNTRRLAMRASLTAKKT